MNQFKISVFPTFLFLNKSGIEEARITGYIEEDVFLNRLKDINAGINILDYYIEKNRTEGGGKYLLEIFNVYGKRKDAENLEATATRIRTEAPELYGAREEYIISALADVMYANRMYESFIPQMETLLSYKVERLLRNDYLKMATAFSRSGRYGDAERIHLLLIKLLPGDITVLTDYLRFLAVNGLIAEPSAVIEGVGFMEPEASEWAEYYYWLSRYYQAIGDSENSGVFMAKAAELAPERYSQVGLFLVYPEKIIYPAVEEGVVLKAELEISNPTGDELELHVMSTCSCLTVSENSLLLKNGETMSVTAVLDTSGESGLIERVLIFRPTSGDRFFEQTVSFKVIVN